MEGKNKATQRKVSQLSELKKGKTTKVLKYSQLSITEALEAAEQWLTALASCLTRYSRDREAQRINRMFTT